MLKMKREKTQQKLSLTETSVTPQQKWTLNHFFLYTKSHTFFNYFWIGPHCGLLFVPFVCVFYILVWQWRWHQLSSPRPTMSTVQDQMTTGWLPWALICGTGGAPVWRLVCLSWEPRGKPMISCVCCWMCFGWIFLERGIFVTGSSLVGAAIRVPEIRSKNLIRYYLCAQSVWWHLCSCLSLLVLSSAKPSPFMGLSCLSSSVLKSYLLAITSPAMPLSGLESLLVFLIFCVGKDFFRLFGGISSSFI